MTARRHTRRGLPFNSRLRPIPAGHFFEPVLDDDPADLRAMGASMEPQALKVRWLDLAASAEAEIERAGAVGVEVGLAFVHPSGAIGWFDDPACVPHRATLGGALPRIVGERS